MHSRLHAKIVVGGQSQWPGHRPLLGRSAGFVHQRRVSVGFQTGTLYLERHLVTASVSRDRRHLVVGDKPPLEIEP